MTSAASLLSGLACIAGAVLGGVREDLGTGPTLALTTAGAVLGLAFVAAAWAVTL